MRRRRVRAVLLGLAAAVGLAAAGCGDGQPDVQKTDAKLLDRTPRGAKKG